jgi:hypothetical protein
MDLIMTRVCDGCGDRSIDRIVPITGAGFTVFHQAQCSLLNGITPV